MGHAVFLYGKSGSGKTSSIRNLDPKRTGIINVDRKALPLENWRESYRMVESEKPGFPDLQKSNYVEPMRPSSVMEILKVWGQRKDLDNIVLDTITHLITNDYMTNTIGKDFKAFQRMGLNGFTIFDMVGDIAKNLLIIGHSDVKFNDMGQRQVVMKSFGNMIESIEPESYFTTVLVPVVDRSDEGIKYLFRTQSDGSDAAKSPARFKGEEAIPALPYTMPNDIALVFKLLDKFETKAA